MIDTAWFWLAGACVAALLASASLHALLAAFEQLPAAQERRLVGERRGDGRRTIGAWLASDPDYTANAAAVAYSIAEAIALVVWTMFAMEVGDSSGWSWGYSMLAALGVAAFLSLIVVRALPRQVGRARPLGTIRIAGPIAALGIVATAPIRAIVPPLRRRPLAEASDIVERAQEALEEDDAELLRSVVNLGETLVREVMVPRTDMITLHSGTDARTAMRMFLRSGRSRLPVVADSADDVVGVLYLKDLLVGTWQRDENLDSPVDELARTPYFVPESVRVDDLLRAMQLAAVHMAIVVDEFGGVAGLVTIEDALEEIVGELSDEHDRAEPEPFALADGAFRVPARMPLDELGVLFDLEIDDEDVETVAGLLTKALGRVPIAGSTASTHGLTLVADSTQGRRKRLAWIIVRRNEGPESDA